MLKYIGLMECFRKATELIDPHCLTNFHIIMECMHAHAVGSKRAGGPAGQPVPTWFENSIFDMAIQFASFKFIY